MHRNELLSNLAAMLRDLFAQHQNGVEGIKINRAHGYVDGYMRVLVDGKFATKQELLRMVYEARASSVPSRSDRETSDVRAPSRPGAGTFQAA